MKSNIKSFSTDTVFILATLLIFMVSVLTVIFYGAEVYDKILSSIEERFDDHTAIAYISSKIRSVDGEANIYTGKLDGYDALIFSENIEENEYLTYIFTSDGMLRELFVNADDEFDSDFSMPLVASENLEFSIENGMIFVHSGSLLLMALNIRSSSN